MSVRFWSLVIWALVGAGGVFWAVKLLARSEAVPAHATMASAQDLKGDLTRFLGSAWAPPAANGAAAPPVADSNLTLVGVISAPGEAQGTPGMALISVNGSPPRPFAVGDIVDGDRLLLSVSQRVAQLGPSGGPATTTLTISLPFAAAGQTQ